MNLDFVYKIASESVISMKKCFCFVLFNPFNVLEAQFLCVLGIWTILDLCKLLLVPINQSEQISFNLKVFII